MKIAETDDYEIWFDRRDSRHILVLLNELSFNADGSGYWGQQIAEKLGYSALGIVDRRRAWFPVSSLFELGPVIHGVLEGFSERIGYGVSMAGYGVLKHSAFLKLSRVISVSPQYSIAPVDVGNFDGRYRGYFAAAKHDGMKIASADLGGTAFIIYDPWHAEDRRHVEFISSAGRQVRLVASPLTNHATILTLASTAAIDSIIKSACADDLAGVRAVVASRRRLSDLRRLNLARRLLPRRSKAAGKIVFDFAKLAAIKKPATKLVLNSLFDCAVALFHAGEIEAAGSAFMSVVKWRRDAVSFELYVECCVRNGTVGEADAMARAIESLPAISPAMRSALDKYWSRRDVPRKI